MIAVEIKGSSLCYEGRAAELILVHDVTDRRQYIAAIEKQNAKLREIAWIQSHVVRAPLARLMGLVQLLGVDDLDMSAETLAAWILQSAHELDQVIHDIVQKSADIRAND